MTTATCPTNTYCLAPSLKNMSRLLQIAKKTSLESKLAAEDVLYLGPPGQLYHTVTVTGYIPRFSKLPLHLPNTIETLCDYMVKFSGGLGILNLVPCIYLDGYWIAGALIDWIFKNQCDSITRKVFHSIVTIIGTALLVGNIVLGLKNLKS